ncbi:ethanolamine utilization microcompartment protein EutL [Lutispora thermophila]|uniref:Ethanolamine utilization protein EutL n=1 Tax=Lutispora thermophila DSM 19022 TaxID=1122184 RepID=A0A1M6FIN4_9FIRM|nr:ethanolamine utilization microcompartment protein EutL [Lutispora thermophila]SHI97545.1 ethanolamine utilization protein EutL [Lutispora thermophila DSM 19022]
MKNDPIRATVLSVKIIPNVDPDMAAQLNLKPHQRSIGILTTDIDDVSYTALDEATKKADVEVVYARSMYAGSANASTKLAGEFIGIIAGPNPAEVRSGLNAAIDFIENDACFYSANDDNTIPYYAHCISRTGSYLSKVAGVEEGASLAYLIAPPLEAMYALDAALKAADVKLAAFYGPPSETNFGGGLLTGSQSACKAACEAFAAAVQYVADNPTKY